MFLSMRVRYAVVGAALAGLIVAGSPFFVAAQQGVKPGAQAGLEKPELAGVPLPEPSEIALPLAEDRGMAATEQALKRLGTTASVMMIVAHPDDEDGALLTYLSRGLGVRTTLLTLTRGEGGQNVMSADSYDALGILRTNELLKADEYSGAPRRTSASQKPRKNRSGSGATTGSCMTPCWQCGGSGRK
jgi:hypothetical protein